MNENAADTPILDTPNPSAEAIQPVKGADLVNLFNYVNFREGTVFVGFRDPSTGETLSVPAFPLPTAQDLLACRWMHPGLPLRVLASYQLKEVLVNDGRHLVLIEGQTVMLDRELVVLKIPEFGSRKLSRTVVRHPAVDIEVEVLQNGLRFRGTLVDFSAVSFLAELTPLSGGTFHGLNIGAPVIVVLQRGDFLLFSAECRILRLKKSASRGSFVLALNGTNFQRFAPKQVRSVRQVLNPSPLVGFVHPLTGKRVSLRVSDLSGGGFSVEEFFENSCLLPGLILPDLKVEIGGHLVVKACGQVLYRNVLSGEGPRKSVKCGVVFLDMALDNQARLASLLHQAKDSHLRVSSAVDMDELWRFFFESGFLYPSKYTAIEASKEHFKGVYEKLYLKSPDISRHFLFQDKGVLFGHMSMLRAYPDSWLIHHHAASKDGYGLAGVAVLEQISRYANEFHNFRSTHMDYVMCYFRKENKFPNRVFGGSATDMADPKAISLDVFSYLHLTSEWDGASRSQILPASDDDLRSLERFYESVSGGLMLDAMNLKLPRAPENELSGRYGELGFRREGHVFSFKEGGVLKAVVTLQLTELGLNLSNLTNCLHAIILDSSLEPASLLSGLRMLGQQYTVEDLPLLVFPSAYLEEHRVPTEKNYTLWVLTMTRLDGYFQSLHKRFHRGKS